MKNAIEMMKSKMNPEDIRKAEIQAEQEILTIRLAKLREKKKMTQEEVPNFTQSSVSRLEKRKDIKISTLIEYLDGLGMGIEIKAYPKDFSGEVREEELLLKV